MSGIELFAALIVAHCLCDYPLQGDFLAKAKNHAAPIPGVPWWQALAAHSIIHGGAVWLITGLWWLGVAEAFAHATIDFAKSNRHINFTGDQFLHLVCKVMWVGLAMPMASGGPLMALILGIPILGATLIIPGPFKGEAA